MTDSVDQRRAEDVKQQRKRSDRVLARVEHAQHDLEEVRRVELLARRGR